MPSVVEAQAAHGADVGGREGGEEGFDLLEV